MKPHFVITAPDFSKWIVPVNSIIELIECEGDVYGSDDQPINYHKLSLNVILGYMKDLLCWKDVKAVAKQVTPGISDLENTPMDNFEIKIEVER